MAPLRIAPLAFADWQRELRRRFGETAAAERHELFFLCHGRSRAGAALRSLAALLRDAWLLCRSGAAQPVPARGVLLVATLAGASGWDTLARAVAAVRASGQACEVLAHPRLPARLFPRELPLRRPARPPLRTLFAALGVLLAGPLRGQPLTLSACLARRRLWQASLRRSLRGASATLLLHNDFDLMSRSVAGLGLPTVCLQHGLPTDEFFPTRADWYLLWGAGSLRAFRAAGCAPERLRVDGLGRGVALAPAAPPSGLALLSQTHARVLGDAIGSHLRAFAGELLRLQPQATILLHPQERQAYPDLAAAVRYPPHPQLRSGAAPPLAVIGYCSTAMLDAALAGHWVIGLELPLAGNHAARELLQTPLRAGDAASAVALYRRLCDEPALRAEIAARQQAWLRDVFEEEGGALVELLQDLAAHRAGLAESAS